MMNQTRDTKTKPASEAERAFKALSTRTVRLLEKEIGKNLDLLMNEAGRPTGDGLIATAVAMEAAKDPRAEFGELWERAEEWTLGDYEALGEDEGDVDKVDPTRPDIAAIS